MATVTGIDRSVSALARIEAILAGDAALLRHECRTISKQSLHLPGPDFVDRVFAPSDRSPRVLTSP